MTSHCRAALEAAGLPLDPPRMSDVLLTSGRETFFVEFVGIEVKQCTKCRQVRPMDDFYPTNGHNSGRFGRRSWCKTCMRGNERDRRRHDRRHDVEAIRVLSATTRISLRSLAARFRTDIPTVERVIAGENPWSDERKIA